MGSNPVTAFTLQMKQKIPISMVPVPSKWDFLLHLEINRPQHERHGNA